MRLLTVLTPGNQCPATTTRTLRLKLSIPQQTAHQQPDYPPPDKIPKEMRDIPAWMGTHFERRADGKLNKPPYCVRDGRRVVKAGKNNPANHASYEEAVAALERGDVDAIGFVLTKNDPFVAVDLDGAVDVETGEISTVAATAVDALNSYTERSVSGTGLHIICEADKPGKDCRRDDLGVECYDGRSGARFLVITGNALGGNGQIQPRQEEIERLYREWWPTNRKPEPSAKGRKPASSTTTLDDEALLVRARRARKTGAKFQQLFDGGDWSGYESQSNADFALMRLLAYWCAGAADRIEALFKRSALYRPPPEKGPKYVEQSVAKLLKTYTGNFFEPRRPIRERPAGEQRGILTPFLADLLLLDRWKGQKAMNAWKVYAHMVIQAAEMGIEAKTKELLVDSDVRTIAEGAGVHRKTVGSSSLPYLVETGRIKWRKGAGGRSGKFVLLPREEVPAVLPITSYTREYINGENYGNGLDVLRRLIRMRSGSAITGKSRRLGHMERVSRLGLLPMFILVDLTASNCVKSLEEIVSRTGRDKSHVRDALYKLMDQDLVIESGSDAYTIAPAFWLAYEKELHRSLIVDAERRQRKQHQKERRENERRLKEGRDEWRAERDPKVVSMAAKRRRDLDREARLAQPVANEHLTKQQKAWREEERLMRDYDRHVERTMKRLGRRSSG